jgi:hypothetical protein
VVVTSYANGAYSLDNPREADLAVSVR